jgi:putative CocE/NonD family hydrolase
MTLFRGVLAMRPRHRLSLAFLACFFLLSVEARPAERYEVTVERGVPAKMRDGAILRADIYRPRAEESFPVLLQRTPYDKRGAVDFGYKAAARGYVVVVQDVRGRYTSEGEWYPFQQESTDGYDTVEWAASLPHSSGKVGMFGGSYVGATQMLAAIAAPPHLAGIFPVMTASNYHDGWTYQGGAFEQWFNESWTSALAQDTLSRHVRDNSNALDWVAQLPLKDYPLVGLGPQLGLEGLAPYFLDWLKHPEDDDFWKTWSIEAHHDKIQVPAYHVGAWYDIFLGGTLKNFLGIRARGATESARRGQRLLIGVGGHAGSGRKIGDIDFGPEATVDLDELMLRWYDHLLKGLDNGVENERPVRIFVMGVDSWCDKDEWPPERTRATRYYLHSAGHAASLAGDGSLGTETPQTESPDTYVYDPADPVPTVGGPLCCDSAHLAPGPRDQRSVENRTDVLVFSTSPFEKNFEVTGPISLELFVSTSAVDTDFTGKLVDVGPDGFAQNLTEGILRARYRNSQGKPELMNPGEVYRLTIDLWATSNVFRAGHRLRLEVSSSNFPRFDRNLNTGQSPESGTRSVKARNTVYHNREHPSALLLPVVPR